MEMKFRSIKLLIINLFITILIINDVNGEDGQCICDVRLVGEYCGSDLNEKNANNSCTIDMFYCGKSNMKAKAIKIRTCTVGYECNKKINGGNACIKNYQCKCPRRLNRKKSYCGSELQGQDCQPNIIYRCPMIRRYNASPQNACPNGCNQSECIGQN